MKNSLILATVIAAAALAACGDKKTEAPAAAPAVEAPAAPAPAVEAPAAPAAEAAPAAPAADAAPAAEAAPAAAQ